MPTLVLALFAFVRGFLAAKVAVVLENAALRKQLAAYLRAEKRPRLGPGDRAFWILLHRLWTDWTHLLVAVKPATVVAWHRGGFRAIWAWKSRPGRPRIPRRHIGFIKRISTDHPKRGEDKIAEELAAKFGVHHSGSTIRRHMVRHPPPRRQQTWRTFVRNHAKELWSCDFMTQYTVAFTVAYVFVVMEIASRRIVHVNVTTAPTLPWVQQQIREATAWSENPRFLVHDSDGIYGQYGRRVAVENDGAKRSYRCHLDLWPDNVDSDNSSGRDLMMADAKGPLSFLSSRNRGTELQ